MPVLALARSNAKRFNASGRASIDIGVRAVWGPPPPAPTAKIVALAMTATERFIGPEPPAITGDSDGDGMMPGVITAESGVAGDPDDAIHAEPVSEVLPPDDWDACDEDDFAPAPTRPGAHPAAEPDPATAEEYGPPRPPAMLALPEPPRPPPIRMDHIDPAVLARRSADLKREASDRAESQAFTSMQPQRQRLPAYKMRTAAIEVIERAGVVVGRPLQRCGQPWPDALTVSSSVRAHVCAFPLLANTSRTPHRDGTHWIKGRVGRDGVREDYPSAAVCIGPRD